MKKEIKSIFMCILYGILLSIISVTLAFIVAKTGNFSLKDTLFIIGILLVILAILSSLGGNPMGLSLQGLGQNIPQYISNSNLEITKTEKNKVDLKSTLKVTFNVISLLISGLICVIINFIL